MKSETRSIAAAHLEFSDLVSSESSSDTIAEFLFETRVTVSIILNSVAIALRKRRLKALPEDYLGPLYEFFSCRILTWNYVPTCELGFRAFLFVVTQRSMRKLLLADGLKNEVSNYDCESLVTEVVADDHSDSLKSLELHVSQCAKGRQREVLLTLIANGGDELQAAGVLGVQVSTIRRYVRDSNSLLVSWLERP